MENGSRIMPLNSPCGSTLQWVTREICFISHILIVIQVLEDKVSEKERELQAEVIQRDQLIHEKLDVCDSLLLLIITALYMNTITTTMCSENKQTPVLFHNSEKN